MTRHSFLFLVAALVRLSGAASGASDEKADEQKAEPLTIKMSAHYTGVKSDVVVRMRVEPDARSRELTVEWIAEDLSGGSHAISLEGANAAVAHRYALRRLSPGRYTVAAILRRSDGSEIRRESFVTVVGVGGPEAIVPSGAAIGAAAGR